MRTVLAGDLGGTKCRFALVSADYAVHRVQQVPTVRERAAFLDRLERAMRSILQDLPPGLEAPVAAGFGTAGVIPLDGGSISRAPNLPLDGFPLAQHVRDRFGIPVTLLNDGRASAWGEYLRGNAKGLDPLLCLFFGTGIGIGLIVEGKPYAGAANAAGEIGHTVFRPGGRPCPCGGTGHFESYCGGRAITERATNELGARAGGWTVGSVVQHAGAGAPTSPLAQAIVDDAAEAAIAVTANACTLLNPAAVVLGGGVISGWPGLEQRLIDGVRAATTPMIHERLVFAHSLAGSDAILWGASAATGALWPRP